MTEVTTSRSFSIKKLIQYLILLAIAGILLFLSFREVKWNDFVTGLKSCNFYWIAASMAVGVIGFIVRALRWRLLLLPLNKSLTFKEAYNGVTIAYLTNFALPRAGEIARCGVVAKTGKVSFEGALGTVVLERGFDIICLIMWIFLLLAFKWNEFGNFISNELLEPLKNKFDAGFFWIIAIGFAIFITIFIALWVYRKKLLQIKFFKKIAEIVKGLIQGLLTAFRMKNKGLFILYTLLLWGTYWLTSYTTIRAFPSVGHLDGSDALFLMIVGGLGWVVPVQGGLGAYHFIVSLALAKVYGIVQTTGVIFATISHESQALVMILCGTLSIISISLSSKVLKNKNNTNSNNTHSS